MSNDLQWEPHHGSDSDFERLRSFTEPLAPVVSNPNETHLYEFAAVIENVIVPRLLMGHVHSSHKKPLEIRGLDKSDFNEFIEMTMDESPHASIAYVQNLLDRGFLFQDILLNLLAPAARELGERWNHDSANFVEVSLGVARLHRILREFDGIPKHMWGQTGMGRHMLLIPTPGEQHTFGLRLIEEFLLRESWQVTNFSAGNATEIGRMVSKESFDVIGLSLSGETLIDSLHSAIKTVRSKSKNRFVKILVGGHIFVERPELLKSVGADAYAPDATSTVTLVNGWVNQSVLTA